ncbi:amino acid ABC transporter [Fulvimarina endophytica]|uniref:Amino acid ABC transporter n=1 Tax=Fulvimarina endophytica TaxID=2293836 RepID=A0A371X127_9HYPH|nr:ABC transporter substrate-binding protein [Fulvimarina endophytica]RFC62940.1 amino acid ABC transporter [Fulvimarina endophytica]
MLKTLTSAFVAASLLTAAPVIAQESDADKDWSTIVVGTEGAYPPFNFTDASGELQGFDIDIAKALCEEMQAKCSFVTQEWEGMIPALQNGNFDLLIASMSITPEREEQIAFSNKYYSTPPALVTLKDSDITGTSAEDMAGKVIGAQVSTTHAEAARDYFPDSDVREYPSAQEYQLELENGRLDAVLDDVVVLDEWLKSDAGTCCKIVDTLPAKEDIYGKGIGIGMRKGDDKLKAKVDEAIQAIRDNGTYKTIQDKYFDFDVYGS